MRTEVVPLLALFVDSHNARINTARITMSNTHTAHSNQTRKPAQIPEAETTKTLSFAHLNANPEEVARLIKEGARKDEAILVDKWQQYFGVKLVGYVKGEHKVLKMNYPADFAVFDKQIPADEWVTIDMMYTLEQKADRKQFLRSFNKSEKAWSESKMNIIKHPEKADIIPMDLTYFDELTFNKIREFVLSLPREQQEKIFFIIGEKDDYFK